MTATYISKLDNSKLSKIGKTIMGSVFVHNNGDILHGLRTEPFRHLAVVLRHGVFLMCGGLGINFRLDRKQQGGSCWPAAFMRASKMCVLARWRSPKTFQ
jgi:hypothetical protein